MSSLSTLSKVVILLLSFFSLKAITLYAGPYTNSAHGDATIGVNRTVTSAKGYARGNCAHCHEQHSSIDGSEPTPANGADSFALFSSNFNTAATTAPYSESDNICFRCHSNTASSGQSVTNYDYSRSFGCGTLGETNILSTMNQRSYHNLNDIYNYAKDTFSWFTEGSNPCNACHNPHLARDNASNPQDISFSVLSKPSDHFTLWGNDNTETMGNSFGSNYEPPFCEDSLLNREPAASNDAAAGRDKTPDYAAFCTDCHTPTAEIYSTTLGRNLKKINWGVGGDKHGEQLTDGKDYDPDTKTATPRIGGGALLRPPYVMGNDYVVSCMDCHEPHGSSNIFLLRRRVNGENLPGPIINTYTPIGISTIEKEDIGYLCVRCHYNTSYLDGDGNPVPATEDINNSWLAVHHNDYVMYDTPYETGVSCNTVGCHSAPGLGDFPRPVCLNCHYHGSTITIDVGIHAGQPDSTRKTF